MHHIDRSDFHGEQSADFADRADRLRTGNAQNLAARSDNHHGVSPERRDRWSEPGRCSTLFVELERPRYTGADNYSINVRIGVLSRPPSRSATAISRHRDPRAAGLHWRGGAQMLGKP
jgi:hypothetical protein